MANQSGLEGLERAAQSLDEGWRPLLNASREVRFSSAKSVIDQTAQSAVEISASAWRDLRLPVAHEADQFHEVRLPAGRLSAAAAISADCLADLRQLTARPLPTLASKLRADAFQTQLEAAYVSPFSQWLFYSEVIQQKGLAWREKLETLVARLIKAENMYNKT